MNIFHMTRAHTGRIYLTASLLAFALVWLLLVGSAQAQSNDGPTVINDALVEESDTGRIEAKETTLDEAGNRYVAGDFSGTVEFGEGRNAQTLTGTFGDLFIAKYDADNNLQWVQVFPTLLNSSAFGANIASVKVDPFFDVLYVTGSFRGQLQVGNEVFSPLTSTHSFVAQMNLETGAVQWVNELAAQQLITTSDLSVFNNVVITGNFSGIAEFNQQFSPSETLLSLTPNGSDMFVVQYDTNGELRFLRQAGGNGAEGNGVFLGSDRTFTVVGEFSDTIRFEDRRNPIQLTSNGSRDGFVARYNSSGDLRFAIQIGGSASDSAVHVVQKRSELYVMGLFREEIQIGSTRLTSRGETDNYLAHINVFAEEPDGAIQIGSNNRDFTRGLAVDDFEVSDGKVYLTGRFTGPELIAGAGNSAIRLNSAADASDTSYQLHVGVDRFGTMTPVFGEIVESKDFRVERIAVDTAGENVLLVGDYDEAVTFGSREAGRSLSLPAPTGQRAFAVAHFAANPGDDDGSDDDLNVFYVSTLSSGSVDGINFRDEDVLAFSTQRQAWTLLIDGSDIGLGTSGIDLDAFHWQADGTALLSVNNPITLPDVGDVDDSDVLRFIPETLGAETSGRYEMFLRGADFDLSKGSEDVDAIAFNTDGQLVVSTVGTANVDIDNGQSLRTNDEDLLVRSGASWAQLFDGSDVELRDGSEDLKGAWIDGDGFVLSTSGDFSLNSLSGEFSGDADDAFRCAVPSTGTNTEVDSCATLFDPAANGLTGEIVDAFSIGRAGTEGTPQSDDDGIAASEDDAADADEQVEDEAGDEGALFLPLVQR